MKVNIFPECKIQPINSSGVPTSHTYTQKYAQESQTPRLNEVNIPPLTYCLVNGDARQLFQSPWTFCVHFLWKRRISLQVVKWSIKVENAKP